MKSKQFEVMQGCVIENLNRGIKLGLYRDNINVNFISRIYFNCMVTLKDQELFPLKAFSMNTLMEYYLEYHLRGICTPKGLEKLNKILEINQNQ